MIFNVKGYQCVGRKGLATINDFTRKYNELNTENPIPVHVFDENENIHEECRKTHSNNRRYEQMRKRKDECESASAKKLGSEVKQFSFRTDCYLGGKYVDHEKAKKFPNNVEYEFSRVMVKETIMKRYTEQRAKQADEWADTVAHRLACINDQPAEEAIYHRRCFQYFMSPSNLDALSLEGAPPNKRGRRSRSVDAAKKSAFVHVIDLPRKQ